MGLADAARAVNEHGAPHAHIQSSIQAATAAQARGPQHAEPWPRRERQGVMLEQPIDGEYGVRKTPLPPNVVPIQEARRLGLRPLPRRSTAPEAWPKNPQSPRDVDPPRFRRALESLCPNASAETLSSAILDAAKQFSIDPFLLGGVLYQQSQCNEHVADAYGIGLTRINPGMFQRGMQHGVYRYGRPDGNGGFDSAELAVQRYPFTAASLRSPKVNAYYAAAMIAVFKQQCPAIDEAFGSVQHRHYVSHFVWGDRVRSTLPEDEILIARRRLLYYYAPYTPVPRARVSTVALSSPLDAPPRIVIGVMGDPRDNGKRLHQGVDFAAGEGEPVRAMAPGVVTFAGADLRAQGLLDMPTETAERVAPGAMGPRGLFVRVQHADGIETLYVHLASYTVQPGQRVRRGELLGVVGRTGVHASDAHLHLGVFLDGLPIDPLPVLDAYSVIALQQRPREQPQDGVAKPAPQDGGGRPAAAQGAARPRATARLDGRAGRTFVRGPEARTWLRAPGSGGMGRGVGDHAFMRQPSARSALRVSEGHTSRAPSQERAGPRPTGRSKPAGQGDSRFLDGRTARPLARDRAAIRAPDNHVPARAPDNRAAARVSDNRAAAHPPQRQVPAHATGGRARSELNDGRPSPRGSAANRAPDARGQLRMPEDRRALRRLRVDSASADPRPAKRMAGDTHPAARQPLRDGRDGQQADHKRP